jgi:short-subunit dehydrogenase
MSNFRGGDGMKGKVVAITGGGSGLGARLARRYSEQGAKVVLLGRSMGKLEKVAGSLAEESFLYALDVSKKKEVESIFGRIREEVGDISILVNCAGVGFFDLAEKTTGDQTEAMIDINLKGNIYCTQEILAPMKAKNEGQIINVISMSGKRAKAGEAVYCASKFGLDGFTKAVALELEETAVRITGIYMGNMATELWGDDIPEEFGKFIDPEDMADVIMETTKFRSYMDIAEVVVKNNVNG